MELKTLKCPECGATFESNEKVSFCSHCGAKLYFDDGKKDINYNYNYKKEDLAKIKEIEVKKELELEKRKSEKHKDLIGNITIVSILIICSLYLFLYFKGAKNKSDIQEQELQNIVNEIYTDIDAGKYEEALIKTKSLYITDAWSDEQEKKWDDTRETIEKLIKKKMK